MQPERSMQLVRAVLRASATSRYKGAKILTQLQSKVSADREMPDAHIARMVELITGSLASQVIRTFAEMSIADLLAEHPASAASITEATGSDLGAMKRLLRAGVALGLVTVDKDELFAGTPLSKTLQQDTPGSLKGWATIMGSPGAWLPWGNFVEAIRTGQRQTQATLGKEYFDYLAQAPAEAEAFMVGMGGISDVISHKAADMIDTRSVTVAADIGGASGAFLYALMARNEKLEGIVFERPNVAAAAEAAARKAGLSRRTKVVAGNFLEAVPESDLYLLKWILHDWDDSDCIKILSNCRRSMRPGGRVIALELQLGEIDDPGLSSLMDLNMLVVLNGRERSAHEYSDLFAAAGLRMTRVTPLKAPLGPWSVLESHAI